MFGMWNVSDLLGIDEQSREGSRALLEPFKKDAFAMRVGGEEGFDDLGLDERSFLIQFLNLKLHCKLDRIGAYILSVIFKIGESGIRQCYQVNIKMLRSKEKYFPGDDA